MTTQTTFFETEVKRKVQRNDVVFSLDFDEKKIIQAIMHLYLSGRAFDLDPTYSKGVFWRGLPEPLHKFDLFPQTPETQQASSDKLPFTDGALSSIMFDPPFVVAPSPAPGIIRDRFSCFKNVKELWQYYERSLVEFYRILGSGGILAVKCQDMVSASKQHLSHVAIINQAVALGFVVEDLFVLGRRNVLLSPNMGNQQHARKNHSYFLVFKKP